MDLEIKIYAVCKFSFFRLCIMIRIAELTLNAPNKTWCRRDFVFYYFYLSKKIRLNVSSESSASRGFT